MSIVRIPTNFNIELELEVADFGRRMVAYLIDMVIQWVIYILLNLLYSTFKLDNSYDQYFGRVALYFPVSLYPLFFESVTGGRSPGKMIMRLKVISQNGGRASISQYVIRWLVGYIDFLLFFPAVLSYAFSKYGQRLGDLAAGTLVIHTRQEARIEDTLFMEVEDTYVPVFPQVMRLSDRDINTIKRVLDRSYSDANADLLFRTADRVATALKLDPGMHPRDFLATLIKDYNYLSVK